MDNDKKIEEIMQSLDGMERAMASPFLYSKIRNRLDQTSVMPGGLVWNLVIVLLLVAVLNIFTISSFSGKQETKQQNAGVIASDYGINDSSEY